MRMFDASVIVLVVVRCTTPSITILQRQKQAHGIWRNIADHTEKQRQQRSVITLGAKVLNSLLKNAKLLQNNDGYNTVFVKSGGVKQAEKDFYTWVSPAKAQETITKDKRGKVGNVLLTLRYDSKQLTLTKVLVSRNGGRIRSPPNNIIFYRD